MKWLISLILFFAFYNTAAQILPTQQMLVNTWNFAHGKLSGTCFISQYEGKSYAVTAKHIFPRVTHGSEVTIQVNVQNKIRELHAAVYFHDNPSVDVAVLVFKLPDAGIPQRIPLSENDLYAGQQLIFLGFPLGISTTVEGSVVPLIKQAIVSAFLTMDNYPVYLLDGHNNVGFSGGPVIAKSPTSKQSYVVGVVSGYIIDPQSIEYDENGTKRQIIYNSNSGIIKCYPIGAAIEIIKKIKSFVK